jgi:hypothetical protein
MLSNIIFRTRVKLVPTYALLSRIRLNSSANVLESAEGVIQHIMIAYSEPNLTPEEIQFGARREDRLREFSEIRRAELDAMQTPLR